jgi:small-conductance mechanosensitive channel
MTRHSEGLNAMPALPRLRLRLRLCCRASFLSWIAVPALLLAGGAIAAPSLVPTPAPPPVEGEASTKPEIQEATVRYFNRDIVTLRGEFLGRSPEVRARAAEENIERIVLLPGTAVVSFKQEQQGLIVLLSGQLAGLVTPEDLDVLHNQTMAEVRSQIARNLGEAVLAAERDRAPRQLAKGVLWSLLATAIAVVLLLGLVWLARRMEAAFQRWVAQRATALRNESVRHLVVGLRTFGNWGLRLVLWLLALLIVEEWARFVLGQFGFTRPWADAMTGWIVGLLSRWGEAIAEAIPGLIAAAFVLFLARLLAQTVSLMFRGVQSGRFKVFGVDSELAEPTRKLAVAIIWLFAIAMAYPYLPGAETDAFKGLSVLVGLMISLGASSIVGQAAGGFTIIYSRTVSIGDFVRIGDMEGAVLQVGLFTTRLRTVTGVEVSIPNNVVLGGQLQNYSRHPDGPGMWLETGVTIGYDTPWRQVQRLLLDAAGKTANVQATPAPYVLQTALSDFYVEYRLRARIRDIPTRGLVLSELHANIQDAFNAAGVQIMSPNYEADPEQPKLVSREHWEGISG